MQINKETIEQLFRQHYLRMYQLARVLLKDDAASKVLYMSYGSCLTSVGMDCVFESRILVTIRMSFEILRVKR